MVKRLSKTVFLAAALIFVIGCIGCKTNNSAAERVPEEHFLNNFNAACVKYEDRIYLMDKPLSLFRNKVLYCIDTASGESFPLCFKPECTHDTPDCGAMIGGGGDAMHLMLYNERLYWIVNERSKYTLRSMALDGSGLRVDAELDGELAKLAFGYGTAEIADGVLYVCGSSADVDGAKPIHRGIVYCQPIRGGSAKEIMRTEGDFLHVFGRISDGRLFFGISDSQSSLDPVPETHPLSLYSYDLKNGELEQLYSGETHGYYSGIAAPDSDTLVISDTGDVLKYSLSAKELSVLFSPSDTLGSYAHVNVSEKNITVTNGEDSSVFDLAGDLVFEGKPKMAELAGEGIGMFYLGGSGMDTYYYLIADSQTKCFFLRYDLENDKAEILWSGDLKFV